MNLRIVSARARIDSLHAKAKSEPVSSDLELQAQLARFLCVLSSGLIEQALILTLQDYSARVSHPRVARFAGSSLARINNAKFEDIMIILGRYDPNWRKHFEDNLDTEVKDAIDSIVNNRNQIAHGAQTGISLTTFAEYHQCVKAFIDDLVALVATN